MRFAISHFVRFVHRTKRVRAPGTRGAETQRRTGKWKVVLGELGKWVDRITRWEKTVRSSLCSNCSLEKVSAVPPALRISRVSERDPKLRAFTPKALICGLTTDSGH